MYVCPRPEYVYGWNILEYGQRSKHTLHTLPPHTHTHTPTHAHARKDINAFAFSPLNLSNSLIFRIVKYAKVTKVNR